MDWNAAIERNREALKRVLAALVAMAGLTIGQSPPLWGRCPAGQRGVRSEGATGVTRPTLPRHLHRAVLRLLRPAEAAVRRLVIVIARELPAPPPAPQRPRKPKPKSAILRNGVGTGIILPRNVPPPAGNRASAARTLCLPLIDPLPRWRHRRPATTSVPRISFPGFSAPTPVPVRHPPAPRDPIDASRLALRLQALGRALDDLPGCARRFARWQSRRDAAGGQNKETRDAGRIRRVSPLRPGRPPGQSQATSRRPSHEIHAVLADLQWFAFKALERPDTS